MEYVNWFKDTGVRLKTKDGKNVVVIDFCHLADSAILELWAKHFRSHYIAEEDIDGACGAMGLTRSEYLRTIKLPDKAQIISGDFSEILVADYLEFVLQYQVPRTRYDNKLNKNTSPFGIDTVGFKLINEQESAKDELITCETKGMLVRKNKKRFAEALTGSRNDYKEPTRLPEALNAIRQRLKERGKLESVKLVERFQDKTSRPYKNISSAVMVCSENCWDESLILNVDSVHPNSNLYLLVLKGESLMTLAKQLYELAYATA